MTFCVRCIQSPNFQGGALCLAFCIKAARSQSPHRQENSMAGGAGRAYDLQIKVRRRPAAVSASGGRWEPLKAGFLPTQPVHPARSS